VFIAYFFTSSGNILQAKTSVSGKEKMAGKTPATSFFFFFFRTNAVLSSPAFH
jgi:hypothetical protein